MQYIGRWRWRWKQTRSAAAQIDAIVIWFRFWGWTWRLKVFHGSIRPGQGLRPHNGEPWMSSGMSSSPLLSQLTIIFSSLLATVSQCQTSCYIFQTTFQAFYGHEITSHTPQFNYLLLALKKRLRHDTPLSAGYNGNKFKIYW